MGGVPKTALALVGIPLNDEKLMKNDLRLALRGLLSGLKTYSVNIIGGHTNEAESTSLGLAINGVVDQERVIKKNSIKLNDRIISYPAYWHWGDICRPDGWIHKRQVAKSGN